MTRINELRLIVRIAQMYHIEGKRQTEIAKHLRISQATISRMLKRAQEEGIVRTTVLAPSGLHSELETGLRDHFDIAEAIVVDCDVDRESEIMSRIGEAAAHYLEATMQNGEIIGVSSWSETILKMVDNVHPMKPVKAQYIVQTLGGMGNPAVQTHATQLTTRLARLTGAEPKLLNAPGVAQSREAKLVLVSDQYIRETIDLFKKVTLSIVGIGAVEPSRMLARSGNVFSESELAEVAEAGGVGDMGLRFFTSTGQPVRTPLDDRVIGMTLNDLARIDRVMALAGGQSKTRAIRGALNAGSVDVLITDRFTAGRLLETVSSDLA